ncbi:MAG: hypothetical protein H0V66_03605 [Bdellovibrionales bacterium]|nr:hypothetical protein [Bdellovibrionales bacterium]
MVDNISRIQQLLAESKFVEAQKEAEVLIHQDKSSESIELLEIYFESLKAQSRPLPQDLLFSLIDKILPTNPEEAQKWLAHLSKDKLKDKQRILLIEIQIAEMKGQTETLYTLISQYQIARYEAHNPNIPAVVQDLTKKYFPDDFQIQLQRLALELMRMDLVNCEKSIKGLILSCFERSSPKGTKAKLHLLYEVLRSCDSLQHLELYKNFCFFMSNGLADKKGYKKVIELIIYVEDFKFQALLLNFLVSQGLEEVAQDYAQEIRQNKEYNYVYLDKFLPHLKTFFFKRIEVKPKPTLPLLTDIDLKVGKSPSYPFYDEILSDISEEEILLAHLLKHQNFSTTDLLEIAVSFVQSEYFMAALKASDLAYTSTENTDLKLRASYLKITCLLKTGDCRAALDASLEALSLSSTQNDILSFLYSQAEAHLRLKEYKAAKKVLLKILAIDSQYRLAKERLERLNAI